MDRHAQALQERLGGGECDPGPGHRQSLASLRDQHRLWRPQSSSRCYLEIGSSPAAESTIGNREQLDRFFFGESELHADKGFFVCKIYRDDPLSDDDWQAVPKQSRATRLVVASRLSHRLSGDSSGRPHPVHGRRQAGLRTQRGPVSVLGDDHGEGVCKVLGQLRGDAGRHGEAGPRGVDREGHVSRHASTTHVHR